MARDTTYLLDILNSARLVLEFAEGSDRKTPETDMMRRFAIIHGIVLVGEATQRISDEFRANHPEIAWHGMAGMRNRLIHGYDRVNLDLVWEVIQEHIPALIALIEPLVPAEDELDQDNEN